MLRIDQVFKDVRFKVEWYNHGVLDWTWTSNMFYVDHQHPWGHIYIWPDRQNVPVGLWRVRYYVDLGDGFPDLPLADNLFEVVDVVTPPFVYDGNSATCTGPVTGGANTNWVYTCENPRATFTAGQTVFALVRLDRIWADYNWHVEVYRDNQFQWAYDSPLNDVDEQWGWNFSYFPFQVSNVQPGNYELRMWVRPSLAGSPPTATVTFRVNQ